MVNHKEYYKREGGGFPKIRAVISFVNLCMLVVFVHQKCSNYTLTNLLFGLCRSI